MLRRINLQLFGQDPDDQNQNSAGDGNNGSNGSANQDGDQGNNQGGNAGDNGAKGNPGNGLPQTQEELNRIIQDRLARERNKQQAGSQNQTSGQATNTQNPPQGNNQTQAPTVTIEQLTMRAQLEAYKSGEFEPKAVEDAVVLAVHAAQTKGEVTEEAIRTELKSVLERNPGWKKAQESGTGFKVGADGQQNGGTQSKSATMPKKSWNKFN